MSAERPKSEVLALFDWRHIISNTTEQWSPARESGRAASVICGSYELMRQRDVAMISDEAEVGTTKKQLHRSEITLNLKQRNPLHDPRARSANQGDLARRARSAIDIRHPEKKSSVEKKVSTNRQQDFGQRRHSMDVSLAKLRQEMNSLRKQDVELLEQLLSLDNSIREFKLSQASLSSSISDLSDDDLQESPDTKTRRWRSRGSLGSDGSDYLTPSSGRSSPGSNPSMSGNDVSGNEVGNRQFSAKPVHNRKGGGVRRLSKLLKGGKTRPHIHDVIETGSGYVRPTPPVRRNSDFRLAETRPLTTLSKRQSTIW